MILLAKVLVTFLTEELDDAAASDATFVASFIDISHISWMCMRYSLKRFLFSNQQDYLGINGSGTVYKFSISNINNIKS